MGTILAQAAAEGGGVFTYWEKVLFDRGPMYVIFGLLVWLIVRYGPGILEGHRALMKTLESSAVTTAQSTERMTETLEDLADRGRQAHQDMRQVKQAIKHGMGAAEKLLTEAGRHRDSDIVIELRRGQEALHNGEVP